MTAKFEDCHSCKHYRRNRRPDRNPVCQGCDVGELFEDLDNPGVDEAFRAPTTRFGESVSPDEDTRRRFDIDAFTDSLEDPENADDADE
jgi:hypothetical protein